LSSLGIKDPKQKKAKYYRRAFRISDESQSQLRPIVVNNLIISHAHISNSNLIMQENKYPDFKEEQK